MRISPTAIGHEPGWAERGPALALVHTDHRATGVAFCEGCELGPHSEGTLLFGTYNTGELWRAQLSSDRTHVRRCEVVATLGDLVLSLEVGPDGTIYYSTYLGILRLSRSAA